LEGALIFVVVFAETFFLVAQVQVETALLREIRLRKELWAS
jgi:hypothetical protein